MVRRPDRTGRYRATVLPTKTPQFALADDAALNGKLESKQVPPGSVIGADKNFGCGSSSEQDCSCLKGYELTIMVKGFSRIFLQNSINLGLNVVTAPDIEAAEGDELEVTADKVVNQTTGKAFAVVLLPKARRAIIDAGGLIACTRKRVVETAGKA